MPKVNNLKPARGHKVTVQASREGNGQFTTPEKDVDGAPETLTHYTITNMEVQTLREARDEADARGARLAAELIGQVLRRLGA